MQFVSKKKLHGVSVQKCFYSERTKSLLLIGGKGQLGSEIEKTFSAGNWKVNILDKELSRYIKDNLEIDKVLLDKSFSDSRKAFAKQII